MNVYATGIATLTGRRDRWPLHKLVIANLRRKLLIVGHTHKLPWKLRELAMEYAFKLGQIRGGSMTNAMENSLLLLIFNATPIADIAADDQSSPATTLTYSLHTADPGEAGTMVTSEAAYTSYARVTKARTSGGFVVTTDHMNPQSNVSFPTSGAAGTTITHFGLGTGVSDNLMFSGTVTPNIAIGAAGITPILTTATAVTFDANIIVTVVSVILALLMFSQLYSM